MRIDLRKLRPGDGFRFLSGVTIFKVMDRFSFGSTVSLTVAKMPDVWESEFVWHEDWMNDIPLWSPKQKEVSR